MNVRRHMSRSRSAVAGTLAALAAFGGAASPTGSTRPADCAPRGAAASAASPPAVALERVPGDFAQPLYVAAPSGDTHRLFVVEKTGRIRIVKDGVLLPEPFLDLSGTRLDRRRAGPPLDGLPPPLRRQRPLLRRLHEPRRRHPCGALRGLGDGPGRRRPGHAQGASFACTSPTTTTTAGSSSSVPTGRLYVGMGDGGSGGDPQDRAQNPRSRLGKLLRLTLGTSPPRVAIYAKGLRNPWRFSFDRDTGALWIGDVGQSRREEIDRLRPGRPPGANLGWNAYEGTLVYDRAAAARLDKDRLVWPVEQYSHDVGQSVTGGYVYRGTAIPGLRGQYVFGDFGSGRVWAMDGARAPRVRLPGADGQVSRLASFGEDAAGELYVVSLAGAVYKIVPAAP